jgi:hypothetical protein
MPTTGPQQPREAPQPGGSIACLPLWTEREDIQPLILKFSSSFSDLVTVPGAQSAA